MNITIVYDNEVSREGLRPGWGFSAFIESEDTPSILFDTGADSPTLLHNMKELNITPKAIETVVISHAHGDHTGGLSEILDRNKTAELYIPSSFRRGFPGRKVTIVGKEPVQIDKDVFSTGELESVEQSLVLKTNILDAASRFGKVYGIVGGFHGFHDFDLFGDLSLIYPCHCTQYKREILDLFPGRASGCGAGLVIEL